MPTFPLPVIPFQPFQTGGLSFGNDRGDVDHAACDLVAPAGTTILSMANGIVWYGPVEFFRSKAGANGKGIMTYEMAVIYEDYIVRYGEIGPTLPKGVYAGATVAEGQHIASVGPQVGSTMLHLEMFRDTQSRQSLTQTGNMKYTYVPRKRFNRRKDLLDPTGILLILSWAKKLGWTL